MKRTVISILLLSLLLSGCSGLLDSSYDFVETHPIETNEPEEIVSVSTYSGLLSTLRSMVEEGTEQGVISVARYDQDNVKPHMDKAITHILNKDPIGSYAVSELTYELGTSAGQSAVSISIHYLHDRSEIKKIQRPDDWQDAEAVITKALNDCEAGVVMYVENYQEVDFSQWVAVYAATNPDKVMELPEVTANLYPDTGSTRVVELKFNYQNTRDALKKMQDAVSRHFRAATILAGGEEAQADKYDTIYSLLMMNLPAQFRLETSITPAYSLLQHSVGDSRAFATVYAAMSTQSGLECLTVTGTKAGEPWYWNIICCDGVYYHLDLLECHSADAFTLRLDEEMAGYVWDYSAYPACVAPEPPPEEEPTEPQPTDPTK